MGCSHSYHYPQTHDSPEESGCNHGESVEGNCSEDECPLGPEQYEYCSGSCARPGRGGCGQCPACMDWGDMEHDRRREDGL